MNKYRIIGVDPGSSSGAVTRMDVSDGRVVSMHTVNMPLDWHLMYWLFRDEADLKKLDPFGPVRVASEQVGGSRPGNSAKSARTFAEHVGALKMIYVVCDFLPHFVLPKQWMKDLFGTSYPSGSTAAEVKARKKYIYDQMQATFPTATFTLRQADSVAIAYWLYKKQEQL